MRATSTARPTPIGRVLGRIGLLAAVAAALCGVTARPLEPASGPRAGAIGGGPSGPTLLVVVDTLRADHLECYGYARATSPAVCGLADDGVLFERAFTPRTSTTPAIASILTGLYPHRHGVRRLYQILPASVRTMAEARRARGERTGAFVSSFVMVREMSGFERGFDVYDDRLSHAEGSHGDFERRADDTVDRALAWLRSGGSSAFLFVHLIEPHGPYSPPGDWASRFAGETAASGPEIDEEQIPPYQRIEGLRRVGEYVARYDGEIGFADAEIGRLFDGLRELGWYDAATIVVTADHGESMGESGQWFRHGRSVEDAEAHVPLIVKPALGEWAGIRPGVNVSTPVSLVEVFPTLTGELPGAVGASAHAGPGFSGSASADGRGLARIARGEGRSEPPLTELLTREGLVVAAHGQGSSLRWTIDTDALTEEGQLVAPDARSHQRALGDPERYPANASEVDTAALAAAVEPALRDLLTHRRGFPVTQRTDVRDPAERARFLAARGDPIVPLAADERERLRQLGYVE